MQNKQSNRVITTEKCFHPIYNSPDAHQSKLKLSVPLWNTAIPIFTQGRQCSSLAETTTGEPKTQAKYFTSKVF